MKYSLVLKTGAEVYKGSGATPHEALMNLQKPNKITVKGVLIATSPEGKKEVFLTPLRIKQLFLTSRSLLAIKAKQIFAAMK